MRTKWVKWAALPLAAIAAWAVWQGVRGAQTDPTAEPGSTTAAPLGRGERMVFRDGRWERVDRRELAELMRELASRTPGLVRVSGTVRDSDSGQAVAGAEVVFANELGESSVLAGAEGRYTIDIRPGFYRAFARADGYVAVGMARLQRLPTEPDVNHIGMPRAELAPVLGVFRDQTGVDMHMRQSAEIVGTVYDTEGHPVAGAVVMGRLSGHRGSRTRLILGTDMDESALDGSFRLEVPAGPIDLTASHEGFAGLAPGSRHSLYLTAGQRARIDLTLAAGCIISGQVVDSAGAPVGDGSLEMKNRGRPPNDFHPVGAITAGQFRFARTQPGRVELRAWPWKSPPTAAQAFDCHDGAHYQGVTFVVPDAEPELEGSVWSRDGQPLAGAYIDLYPLEQGGMAQQERADVYGEWAFYSLPPGRYRVTAYVPGHGVGARTVTAPSRGVRLDLSGTGAIAGATDGMDDGSFLFEVERCIARAEDGSRAIFGELAMQQTRQIVPVKSGTFRIDGLPACALQAAIRTPDRSERVRVDIEAGHTASLSLDLRAPRLKSVHGVVMDPDRAPVSDAAVSRMASPGAPMDHIAHTTTDAQGRYELEVYTGDTLYFRGAGGWAEAQVSWSDEADERIDVTLHE